MEDSAAHEPAARFTEHVRSWGLQIERRHETESSIVGLGARGSVPVVLKVIKRPGDEWWSGSVLAAFGGNGMARVYEYAEGAVLLERLDPGRLLAESASRSTDADATAIVADVIRRMAPDNPPSSAPSASDWGKGFAWYRSSRDNQISAELIEHAEHTYAKLIASQQNVRLLHGDLHHYNILLDKRRGWLAIDPKGVVGEVEYEIGASMRNPADHPGMFASRQTIERRVGQFEAELSVDAERTLEWAFGQAVLSAIWGVEDGYGVSEQSVPIILARAILPMLDDPS